MSKVLFDTNIILDIALKRVPHYKASSELFVEPESLGACSGDEGFVYIATLS